MSEAFHGGDHIPLIMGSVTGVAANVVTQDVANWLMKLVGSLIVGVMTGLILKWVDRKRR